MEERTNELNYLEELFKLANNLKQRKFEQNSDIKLIMYKSFSDFFESNTNTKYTVGSMLVMT